MKIKFFKLLFLSLITLTFLSSCSSDSDIEGTSKVQFKLVDAPGDYLEVNVEIVDIQYNNSADDDSWKSFTSFSGPVKVDLTTLIAGNSLLLSDEIIESGMLKQIRLVLGTDNTLLIDGETNLRDLSTPSAQQSGLKLMLNQELEAGFTYSFILDWDVQKSIVKAGNSGNYNLKPTIRVNAEKSSATITGTVIDDNGTLVTTDDEPLENALVSVYNSSDLLIAETYTNTEGKFTVQGLPEGDYKVKVNKDNFIEFTSTAIISASVGEILQIDTILLVRN